MRRRARLSIVAAAVIILLALFAKALLALVAPFLIALFLAAVIDPVVDGLEKRGIGRGVGAFGVIAALGSVVALATWIVLANLMHEAQLLRDRLPEYDGWMEEIVELWVARLSSMLSAVPHPLDDALLRGAQQALDAVGNATSLIVARAGGIPGALVIAMVSLTTTYFISRDKRQLGTFLFRFMPRAWHSEIRQLKEEITNGLLGFVRAQAILVTVSGLLSIVGLMWFKVPYAWILGTLAGVLDIVPMVGPSGVFVPIILWKLVVGEWTVAFGLGCVWLLILLVRQVLEPTIVGREVGLHPVTSIAAMYLGGSLLGLNGIVIGPLVAIAIKAVCVVSLFPHLRQE